MKTLNLDVSGKAYPIVIGSKLISSAASWEFLAPKTPLAIITQDSIAKHYLSTVLTQLSDFQVTVIVIAEGETHKNLNTVAKIAEQLQQAKIPRNAALIALGGGIVGDITGFVASIYQRGISFIQVPTTLLAQVDSSVGGKTGVNLNSAKNILGTFYQPERVLIDVSLLRSLPVREYASGLAELIKYGLILDASFFERLWLEREVIKAQEETVLIELIYRACELKAMVVKQDEYDHGLRMILNFGHTFAHALETYYHYTHFLHGEAVALGMLLALKLGSALGYRANSDIYPQVKTWLAFQGLPVKLPENLDFLRLIEIMRLDKKKIDDTLRFIILEAVGHAKVIDTVSLPLLTQVLAEGL